MNKSLIPIIFLFIYCIILFSCNKEENVRPENHIEYFPNKIGYQWKYQSEWEDDTAEIVVTIIGDTTFGTDTFKVWEYVVIDKFYGEFVWDYQFVNSSRNLIITLGPVLPYLLIQPLEVGNWWIAPSVYPDSVFVKGIDQIQIESNIYDYVFHLHREYHKSYGTFSNDYWIKPYVGMVKFTEQRYWGSPPVFANETTWNLIDYNFNQ